MGDSYYPVDPAKKIAEMMAATEERMYGMSNVIRLCLVALFTDGHVLLEGNPGLGKTALVKTLCRSLSLPYNRIQFTPDLMPSDITGTEMPGQDLKGLKFQPGPIFTSLLLADEINRATPKTQSAMLEAMAERQVTVLGTDYKLSQLDASPFLKKNGQVIQTDSNGNRPERPFMVLATQNPIEHEGTFNLPEAQSDRFMFKILMPIPQRHVLEKILEKETKEEKKESEKIYLNPDNYAEALRQYPKFNKDIRSLEPIPSVNTHVANLFQATNNRFGEITGITAKAQRRLKDLVGSLRYGLGPRAAIALILGAKAWSCFFNDNSDSADGKDLAQVIIPGLRHRIRLNYDWESNYKADDEELFAGADQDRKVDVFLFDLINAAAPSTKVDKPKKLDHRPYYDMFPNTLRRILEGKTF